MPDRKTLLAIIACCVMVLTLVELIGLEAASYFAAGYLAYAFIKPKIDMAYLKLVFGWVDEKKEQDGDKPRNL